MFPYRGVPSTESEESFRSRQGIAGVQKLLMMIRAPEPVEYIQPAPQVQYTQPHYVQQATAVEQFSVTHLHGRVTGGECLGAPPSQRLPTRSCNRYSRTCRAEMIRLIMECHEEAVEKTPPIPPTGRSASAEFVEWCPLTTRHLVSRCSDGCRSQKSLTCTCDAKEPRGD